MQMMWMQVQAAATAATMTMTTRMTRLSSRLSWSASALSVRLRLRRVLLLRRPSAWRPSAARCWAATRSCRAAATWTLASSAGGTRMWCSRTRRVARSRQRGASSTTRCAATSTRSSWSATSGDTCKVWNASAEVCVRHGWQWMHAVQQPCQPRSGANCERIVSVSVAAAMIVSVAVDFDKDLDDSRCAGQERLLVQSQSEVPGALHLVTLSMECQCRGLWQACMAVYACCAAALSIRFWSKPWNASWLLVLLQRSCLLARQCLVALYWMVTTLGMLGSRACWVHAGAELSK